MNAMTQSEQHAASTTLALAAADAFWPGLDLWPIDALNRMAFDFDGLPYSRASELRLLVGRLDADPCLVISQAASPLAWDWLQGRALDGLRVGAAQEADFEAILARHGADMRAMDSVSDELQSTVDEDLQVEELTLAGLAVEPNPVVRVMGSTLFDAFRSGASDIHVESNPAGARIQYRLDGVLVPGGRIEGRDMTEQAISRIKVLSALDVGERRVPQDGRFRMKVEGRAVDFRVSIMPSAHGEDAVLRILDRRALADEQAGLNLERLGFGGPALDSLRELARRQHGMLLVTGPTGSGKTTTLYAALSEVNSGRQKIITIEDPVEYQLQGVLQVPVNEKTGLTFARGLRAILRHDPDTLLVGEIRDEETAQIAVQAALTGHLVLSSIHANTVFDVLARFFHMGVDPYNLTSALNGVVAQRLIRLGCPRCAEPVEVPASLRARYPALADLSHSSLGRGCGDCRGTGYRGRKAIAEVLRIDDAIREGILQRESPRALRARAVAAGMETLADRAADLVAAHRTSLEELERVADAH